MASADRVRLAFKEETVFGTSPSGSYQTLRLTGESLRLETDVVESNELRSDRNVVGVKRVNVRAAGGISIQMSYGAYDELLAAALFSSGWSTSGISPVTVSAKFESIATSSTAFAKITRTIGSFVTDGFSVGRSILVAGAANSLNNGFKKIVSVTTLEMEVTGGDFVTDAVADSITITQGAVILNGTTQMFYTLERTHLDLVSVQADAAYARFAGMVIDQFSMGIAVGAIMTGGFEFLGKSEATAAAALGSGGTPYIAAPTNDLLNSIEDIDAIVENNSLLGKATGFSFTLVNNLRARGIIGLLGADSIGEGRVGVSGTLQAYYATKDMMDRYLNGQYSSITVPIQDAAGNGYVIDIPHVRFTRGQRVAGGTNTDIIADMAWTADMSPDANTPYAIRIARFPAP